MYMYVNYLLNIATLHLAHTDRSLEIQCEISKYFNPNHSYSKFKCNLFSSSVYTFSEPAYSPDSSPAFCTLCMFHPLRKFINEV